MKVRVLPAADRDISDAYAWYAIEASREVANRFLDAVQSAVAAVADMPGRGRR